MATIELDLDSFKSQVDKGEGILFIDFWASWCGPCKAFGPIYEGVAEDHPDITFAKVDTEKERELAGGLGIRSIPTLMVFRDGIMLFNQAGMLPKQALEDVVGQVRALDMDEVRQKIAEEEAKAEG